MLLCICEKLSKKYESNKTYVIKWKSYTWLGFVYKAENRNKLTKLKTTRKLAESDTKKSISDGSTYENKRIIKIYKLELTSLNTI